MSTTVDQGPQSMDFPDVLFKFAQPQHATNLVELGEVSVGTLDYYRGYEDAVVPLRGDKGEATYNVKGILNLEVTPTMPDAAQKYEQLARGVTIEAGGASISVINTKVDMTLKVNKPLCIYCTSMVFDETQMAKFGGACVEIFKPQEFWSTLGEAIGARPEGRHHRRVQYVESRTFDPLGVPPLNAVWMKPRGDYGLQREYRMAYELDAPPAKPLTIMRCERLRDYCRLKNKIRDWVTVTL